MKSIIKLDILYPGMFVFILGCSAALSGGNLVGDSEQMTQINFSGPITFSEQQLPYQPQGITGVVLSLKGDHMPTYDSNQSRSDSQPVSTKIWIFSGKIPSPGSPFWSIEDAQQHSNLIGWVQSDSNGHFEVGLSPGEYTVFAEYGSELYLNQFSGDGSFTSINVTAHQVTEIQLINTENATF